MKNKVIQFLENNAVMINSLMSKDEEKEFGDVVDKITTELRKKNGQGVVQSRFLIRKEISDISNVYFDEKKECLILQIICDRFPLKNAYEIHPCIEEYRYNGKELKGYYGVNDDTRLAKIMGVEFTDDGRVMHLVSASWKDHICLLKVLDEMYRQVQEKHIVLPEYIRL